MIENIKFTYLYRDAGNYKSWATIVFSNPDAMPLHEIENRLRQAFDNGDLFIASQVSVREVFLYTKKTASIDDHCFHEFDSVEITAEAPDDLHKRTIRGFIKQVETASIKGWRYFDPYRSPNNLL